MLDYDNVMTGDWNHRSEILRAATPEEKAELLKTHRLRWLFANRQWLSSEQVKVLEEDIALITPDLYRLPRNEELYTRQKQHEARVLATLPREVIWSLTLRGPRIPQP